jgi:predicted fused transcriptional regulator/phosphomethylpyrimidine kinase
MISDSREEAETVFGQRDIVADQLMLAHKAISISTGVANVRWSDGIQAAATNKINGAK